MPEPYHARLEAQRAFFYSGRTRSYESRRAALLSLREGMQRFRPALLAALAQDLGKSRGEGEMLEVGQVMHSLDYSLKCLWRWMKPQKIRGGLVTFPASSRLYHEPLGLALILAPWNYPLQLSLIPLLNALSAGNCVTLKPSSAAPASSAVLAELLSFCFPPEQVWVAQGDSQVGTALLAERFDFIFYTGSSRVGKIVMEAAARHLTPVCLELGGKCPVIVAKDAHLGLAAKRIAWGKLVNAGQTCAAPDHIWADRSIAAKLQEEINASFTAMLGPDPLRNPEYARIISPEAFDRIQSIAPAGCRSERRELKIAPLAFAASPDHPSMREEIFGPILPVLSYSEPDEAFQDILSREKPLALYLFTSCRAFEARALERIASGGCCLNDVLLHLAVPGLPFGGVGHSGMGRYHGRAGFHLFSNPRGMLRQSADIDLPLRYPPFSAFKLKLFKKFLG